MTQIAKTPEPPYYAVIFTSERTETDAEGYATMADAMVELAAKQPGFLGIESARSDGLGITVSYWSDLAAIANWKANSEHLSAQRLGQSQWYEDYQVRIARVEKAYGPQKFSDL
ncbi:MAG TPA: antibiotic biosynthesis monooxygenase [Planctomycetaceae bacterium]|nr:antibiotic biosynthesis monooxygenase [Planctomycetaceae bacterium]